MAELSKPATSDGEPEAGAPVAWGPGDATLDVDRASGTTATVDEDADDEGEGEEAAAAEGAVGRLTD